MSCFCSYFASVCLFLIGAYALCKIYLKLTTGWCKSHTCLVGKTTIITGANTGIGYGTALEFAKRGARVILACRNLQKAEEARTKIIGETGNENVTVKLIDLASFDSVRDFAQEINKEEDRLDILVNNAGALHLGVGDHRTKDGHALLMQTNHFSVFLLTNLLIGLLKKSKPSRVINLASTAAKGARNFDINKIDEYISYKENYHNTKLCNILFTKELAKKLEGSGVITFSVQPGLVKTDIFNTIPASLKLPVAVYLNLFAKTVEEGAQTTIYCSVAKGLEKYNGEHFADCQKVEAYATTRDPGLPKKLWEKSEEIVGLKPNELQF